VFIRPDCIPCIVKVSLDAARLAGMDEDQVRKFTTEILKCEHLRGEGWSVTSAEVIRNIWTRILGVTGEPDPFETLKAEQNRSALKGLLLARKRVLKSGDPLVEALKFAIAGNSMDAMLYGRQGTARGSVEQLANLMIDAEQVSRLRRRLSKARSVVYFGDNCGEIVFDKLLVEVMRETFDLEVIFVTRTLPVLNDATMKDAMDVGMDEVAQVVENGIPEPLPGTMLDRVSSEVRTLVEGCQLLISKGGGNHDILTREEKVRGRISFLLQAKCHPYCTLYRMPLGALIVHNA
jgi:uncharacterized protein with ATP-grasp and redox domains